MATPLVSVIVPVLNAEDSLNRCLQAVVEQTYPQDRYEVIVVDNGSSDRSMAIASSYERVTVTRFTDEASSYGARNTGVQEARGDVLAFCDADCLPVRDWIAEGIRALEAGNDVAAGHVQFEIDDRPSGAELCDAISNMQIEENVRERGVGKTANLFVRRDVFDTVGPFPVVRSGGDVIWTSRLTEAGLRLVYAPDAVVHHPARRLSAMVAKQVRVGTGQVRISRASGESRIRLLLRTIRLLVPSRPSAVRDRLELKGYLPGHGRMLRVVRVWMAGLACRIATVAGRILGVAELLARRRR